MPYNASDQRRRLSRPRRLHLEQLEPRRQLSAANLLITEFMATNSSTLISGDLTYEDWIEVHNADSAPVDLSDYYLTDNLDLLTKWALPSITLSPDEYLVVFSSAPVDEFGNSIEDKIDDAEYFHASFKLDSKGEELALSYQDPSTQGVSIVDQYAPIVPSQFPDVSYGVASDSQLRYFDVPTPGGPNGAGLLGVVEDTQFSIDRGFFDAPFQVEITSATAGADIYFTTDGSAPGPGNGTLYGGPVTIDHTTTLRAVATKSGYLSTNIDTQTYLFLNDIVSQTRQTAIDAGYPALWQADNGTFSADYGFDQDVIGTFDANGAPLGGDLFGGVYAAQLQQALLAAPTMSIVMDRDDLFLQDDSAVDGIYIDPRGPGDTPINPMPERATSIEWITSDDSAEMQVDAGIQMQGGAFRSHALTRKHSFRLVFKDGYGPSELSFPLYGENAASQFNTLVLKATANDGYSWNSGQQTLQYARDQFGHSLQLAMGHASPHDNYVHLYINGLYWGVYSVQERPDAEFAASYLGVNPDTWDALHVDEFTSGNEIAWIDMLSKAGEAGASLSAYQELQGENLDSTPSATAPTLLDVENYIDYLIINVWGGNDDWPHRNFWAGRDRSPSTTEGFQFFLWDFDGVMGNSRGWSPLDTKTFNQDLEGTYNAGQPHEYLKSSMEYRLQFADRVHRYFFNSGLLTPANLIARYQGIADHVEEVLVAESARWGDLHSSIPLTPAEWEVERDWLLDTYLPQRSTYVLQEMRDYGFYPDTDAPVFNQHGGFVSSEFNLTIQASAGTIYYTLDGSDPRLVGGAVNSSAHEYNGQPIGIAENVKVRARALSSGEWSALNEAEFSTTISGDIAKLRIVELQYHPADFSGVEDDEDLEYIELLNTDASPVSLDGVQIADFASVPYTFDSGLTLAPGDRIVVARNVAAFQSVYGTEINLAPTGYSDRNLSNGGESVKLLGPEGQVIQSFTYSDDSPWPAAPDGTGRSLELVVPLGDASDPGNWRASLYHFGSPGVEGLPIPGDYDINSVVEEADYLAWRSTFGTSVTTPGSGADGNHDGVIDTADYTVWRDHLGDSTTLYGALPNSMLASLSTDLEAAPAAGTSDSLQGDDSQDEDTAARQAVFAIFGDLPSFTADSAIRPASDHPPAASSFDNKSMLLHRPSPTAWCEDNPLSLYLTKEGDALHQADYVWSLGDELAEGRARHMKLVADSQARWGVIRRH